MNNVKYSKGKFSVDGHLITNPSKIHGIIFNNNEWLSSDTKVKLKEGLEFKLADTNYYGVVNGKAIILEVLNVRKYPLTPDESYKDDELLWYLKLNKKLQAIHTGSLSLEAYITEVQDKIKILKQC